MCIPKCWSYGYLHNIDVCSLKMPHTLPNNPVCSAEDMHNVCDYKRLHECYDAAQMSESVLAGTL